MVDNKGLGELKKITILQTKYSTTNLDLFHFTLLIGLNFIIFINSRIRDKIIESRELDNPKAKQKLRLGLCGFIFTQ